MRFASICLALALLSLASPAIAKPVMHGEPVAIARSFGEPRERWEIGRIGGIVDLTIAAASERSVQTFVIEKIDVSNGLQIVDGDRVRIRSINTSFFGGKNPWVFSGKGNHGFLSFVSQNVSDSNYVIAQTVFEIKKAFGGSPGKKFEFGDGFSLVNNAGLLLFKNIDNHIATINKYSWEDTWDLEVPTAKMLSPVNAGKPAPKPKSDTGCAYFTVCNPSSPNPGSGSGGGGTQSVRAEIVGSAIYVRMSNSAAAGMTCRLRFVWSFDSFGETQSQAEDVSVNLPAGSNDIVVWKISGSYVNPRLGTDIQKTCQ